MTVVNMDEASLQTLVASDCRHAPLYCSMGLGVCGVMAAPSLSSGGLGHAGKTVDSCLHKTMKLEFGAEI